MTYETLLAQERPGILYFGGARMALLDVEAGFWALRRQMEALTGKRSTDLMLQQAGTNGGASFARAFAGEVSVKDGSQALRDCIAAYQAAGFGRFEIEDLEWPFDSAQEGSPGRVLIRAQDAFEAWTVRQHRSQLDAPVCAYTAGVLVGFINVLTGRQDVVCIERTCQAQGAEACLFELLPAEAAGDAPVVAFAPDPALGRQLNLLELLFDRMPMGIAVVDREYRIQRYNPTWNDFSERYAPPSGAPLAPGIYYFDHLPGTESTVMPLFDRALAGETIRMDSVRLESEGIVTYWDVVLAPIVDGEEVTGVFNITIDATGRVQTRQELEKTLETLREREERLALVMEGINDGVWDWDIEADQVYFSPRWKNMLGYAEDEIPNAFESWESLIHPDDRERSLGTLQEHLDGRTPLYRLEHRLRHRDGDYRWILARGKVLRHDDGTPYRLVGSHTDITERRQAEEALHYRVAFENVVSTISTDFINMPLDEIDVGIHRALQTIGQFMEVDRSYLFRFSEDRVRMSCTHEWSAPGIEPQIDQMKDVPVAEFAWSNRQLLNGESLHVPRVADLPPEAEVERREFLRQEIQSLVVVPMVYRGSTIGFVGFDSVREEKAWSEDSIQLLHLVAAVFANALEHKRAQAIQAGQRQFLELLAMGGGFSETLHTLVRIIEEQWPGMLGLVLLLDEDGRHLHVGASVSLPKDYVASIEGLEIGPMVGSCGTASYLGERVIVEDINIDPRWDGLRSLAQTHGLRACWSEPVFSSEGRVVGTFAMYYRHPRSPTEGELRTIETAAHLVGVAHEHKKAQEALRESQRRLSTLISNLPGMAYRCRNDANWTMEFVSEGSLELTGYPPGDLIGNRRVSYADLIHPDEKERVWREVQAALKKNRPFQLTYRILTPAGEKWVWEQGQGVPAADGSIPIVEGFVTDITARVAAQRNLEQRVEERTRELSTLLEVSHNVNSTLELAPLLDLILDQVKTVVDYTGTSILTLENGDLVVEAYRGPISQQDALTLRFPIEGAPANREVIRRRKPVLIQDVRGGTRLARLFRDGAGEALDTTFGYVRSWLGVPLMVKNEVIGMLTFDHSDPDHFTIQHAELAMAFANQVAVAIENARLFAHAEEAAVAAERNRLARDLHDAVTQTLFSSSLIAEVLPRIWETDPEEGERRLGELRELTRGALAEMRTLLLELRPSALMDTELSDLLRQLAESITGRARVPVELAIEGSYPLPSAVKVALYRVAQEALNNVAKHASASQARVSLRYRPEQVTLEVRDDGQGFDPESVPAESLGLGIMRERVAEIGAELEIDSEIGRGTRVVVVWEK